MKQRGFAQYCVLPPCFFSKLETTCTICDSLLPVHALISACGVETTKCFEGIARPTTKSNSVLPLPVAALARSIFNRTSWQQCHEARNWRVCLTGSFAKTARIFLLPYCLTWRPFNSTRHDFLNAVMSCVLMMSPWIFVRVCYCT